MPSKESNGIHMAKKEVPIFRTSLFTIFSCVKYSRELPLYNISARIYPRGEYIKLV